MAGVIRASSPSLPAHTTLAQRSTARSKPPPPRGHTCVHALPRGVVAGPADELHVRQPCMRRTSMHMVRCGQQVGAGSGRAPRRGCRLPGHSHDVRTYVRTYTHHLLPTTSHKPHSATSTTHAAWKPAMHAIGQSSTSGMRLRQRQHARAPTCCAGICLATGVPG